MNGIQKAGLAVASVGLALGGIFGVSQITSANAATQTSTAQVQAAGGTNAAAPGGQAQSGAPTELAAQIATAFNLDQAKVTTALNTAFTSAMSANAGAQPGSDAMDSSIASSLSSSLGVDATKVKEILTTFKASMGTAPSGASGTAASGTAASGAAPAAASGSTTTAATTTTAG